MQNNLLLSKKLQKCIWKFRCISKKFNWIIINDCIRKNKRTIGNIISPDIKKPGNIIKTWKDMRITSIFFHFQAYTGQFGFNTLSGILIFKQKCRFRRKIRSICPNFRCKILQKVYRCMILLCELTVGRSFFIADSSSVKTENLSFLKLFLKKFFNRGNSGFTGSVKINPTAC